MLGLRMAMGASVSVSSSVSRVHQEFELIAHSEGLNEEHDGGEIR